jgi:predicted transcriptional regulator of viral defense system
MVGGDVICLISALVFHRMTTQVSHAVYLTIAAKD